jgi:hypothetical protein
MPVIYLWKCRVRFLSCEALPFMCGSSALFKIKKEWRETASSLVSRSPVTRIRPLPRPLPRGEQGLDHRGGMSTLDYWSCKPCVSVWRFFEYKWNIKAAVVGSIARSWAARLEHQVWPARQSFHHSKNHGPPPRHKWILHVKANLWAGGLATQPRLYLSTVKARQDDQHKKIRYK